MSSLYEYISSFFITYLKKHLIFSANHYIMYNVITKKGVSRSHEAFGKD